MKTNPFSSSVFPQHSLNALNLTIRKLVLGLSEDLVQIIFHFQLVLNFHSNFKLLQKGILKRIEKLLKLQRPYILIIKLLQLKKHKTSILANSFILLWLRQFISYSSAYHMGFVFLCKVCFAIEPAQHQLVPWAASTKYTAHGFWFCPVPSSRYSGIGGVGGVGGGTCRKEVQGV